MNAYSLGTEWVVELTRPGVDKVKAKVRFKYSSPMILVSAPVPLGLILFLNWVRVGPKGF